MRLFAFRLILFVLIVALSGCSRSFYVFAIGDIEKAVIFQFTEKEDSNEASEFNISNLWVQEKVGSDWKIVWELEGKHVTRSVRYGDKSGFIEKIPAAPLIKGHTYRVIASDAPRLKPPGTALRTFVVNQDGSLVAGSVK